MDYRTYKKIKKHIQDYIEKEFGYRTKIDNVRNIGLAYTTLTDKEIPIQVSVDLVDMKIKTWIGDENCSEDSLVESIDITVKELIDINFDFDSLIYGWTTYIENNIDKNIGGK